MSRHAKLLLLPAALILALVTTACGTERIIPKKVAGQPAGGTLYHGAVLFSQRCAGCHTLDAAGTHGSAPNIRDAQGNSGPNFNQRCERPIDRVLYAIENGGFSGAYMPQNIVVGHDAVDVAEFVSKYAGKNASANPGEKKCHQRPMGSLPADTAGLTSGDTVNTAPASTRPATGTTQLAAAKPSAAHATGVAAARRPAARKHD